MSSATALQRRFGASQERPRQVRPRPAAPSSRAAERVVSAPNSGRTPRGVTTSPATWAHTRDHWRSSPVLPGLLILFAAGALLLGCGERPVTVRSAIDQARLDTRLALESSFGAVDAAAPYLLQARYNPAPCTCPDFEVRYLGRWHRVYLNASSAELSALRAYLEGAPAATRSVDVVGTPTGTMRQLETDVQAFEVFDLDRVLE